MLYNRNRKIEVEDLPIRMSGCIRESIVDGYGLRFVVFVQGCPHKCLGCHNPETHDFEGGYMSSTAKIWKEIEKNSLLRGVTFSGGEPFMQPKQLAAIGKAVREKGMDIFTYSGFTYEQLLEMAEKNRDVHDLLCVTNYLVDGKFVLEKRNLNLLFRGSENQRIWDITCYPNSKNAIQIE